MRILLYPIKSRNTPIEMKFKAFVTKKPLENTKSLDKDKYYHFFVDGDVIKAFDELYEYFDGSWDQIKMSLPSNDKNARQIIAIPVELCYSVVCQEK